MAGFSIPEAKVIKPRDFTEAEKQLLVAERALKNKKARENLLDFIQLMMPDPNQPLDVNFSRYEAKKHHKRIVRLFERAESGLTPFTALSIPPQHGKSTITTHHGPAWALGRQPYKHIIVGGYGSDFITKFGSRVRTLFESRQFSQIFPDFELKKGSKAKDYMETVQGGSILFVGRGEGTTGNPCDMFIIDDPIKDKKEADSPTMREDLWDWYTSVAETRCHILSSIFIIHTRWHEDDLIGRLCDPEHPEHDEELAADWHYENIEAIVEDEIMAMTLGIEPGTALWPERFPLELLEKRRRRAPKVFSSLYQGRPTPDDGDFFTRDMIQFYTPDQLPPRLRIYAASDHAVTEKQENDETVCIVAGVDEHANIFILDCWHGRRKSDVVVERMIDLMDKWRPLFWWAASDHISKAIGPFLKKRMKERGVYTMISESSEVGDKQQKAQSIQGRMSMGKVYLPKHAPWASHLIRQLLRFPQATHDDFVDAMAHLGRGINKMVNAGHGPSNDEGAGKGPPKPGTMAWIKWSSRRQERQQNLKNIMGGM
jgi:predicted phage terminase large subunit-like protein